MILWIVSLCVLGIFLVYGVARHKAQLYSQTYKPIGRFVQIDGAPVHFHDTGEGRVLPYGETPLVFIHGASSNLRDPLMAFNDQFDPDKRLIFIDRPGHGYSARHSAKLSDPREQADVIAKLLSVLQIEKAIVVGHSWGGAVAVAMGLKHSDRLAGLVFLAPATHPWPGGVLWYYTLAHWPIIGPVFAWSVAAFVGRSRVVCAAAAVFAPDKLPNNYTESVGAELALRPSQFLANAADIAGLKQHVSEMSRDYPTIATPALIITGTQDDVVWPHLHAQGLLRDLPNAELVAFENCGHMPHHSRKSETVEAVQKFADKVSAATGVGVQ